MLSKIARLVKRFPVRFLDFYIRLSRNRIAHFNVRFSRSDRWSKHFTRTIRVSLSGKQSVSFPISQRSSQHINRFRCISMQLFRKFPLSTVDFHRLTQFRFIPESWRSLGRNKIVDALKTRSPCARNQRHSFKIVFRHTLYSVARWLHVSSPFSDAFKGRQADIQMNIADFAFQRGRH